MIAIADKKYKSEATATWQEEFLEMMPTIEKYARFAFRGLDEDRKEDAVVEITAHAMCAFRRLFKRGELKRIFATSLARYAIKQFHAGRRVGTPQSSRDVWCRPVQQREGFRIRSLNDPTARENDWMDCLIDARRTAVPDQVAFRIDFPDWLARQSNRNQRIVAKLSHRFTTDEVAEEFQISPGRVSQLRNAFADSWEEFNSTAGNDSGCNDNFKNRHKGK